MSEGRVKIVDQHEMVSNLETVDISTQLRRDFYPFLFEKAGQELFPEGIVMFLIQSIDKYQTETKQPVKLDVMFRYVPAFIYALIGNQPEAIKVTLRYWKLALSKFKTVQ